MISLLAARLHIPPPRPSTVARRRLLDRLAGALRRKLTLISTPAGLTKTTLLGEWRASRSEAASLACVLLDEQDSDPVRFWSHVLADLGSVRPGAIGLSSLATSDRSSRLLRRVVTAPANDLNALDYPIAERRTT